MARKIATFVLLLVLFAAVALAQQTTATLTGIITDPSGAVIPNVSVKVVNLATNVVRETTTSDTGGYTLPFLPAGDYSVVATAPGFQTQKIDSITLQVQQTARVDMKL